MKASQIDGYSKNIRAEVRDIPVPTAADGEILIKVKAAAVNPLEILIMTGKVKLICPYVFPLTLGNECSGTVEQIGRSVKGFEVGDKVYARLPIGKIGALAEYASVDASSVAKMPPDIDFDTAAAIPLTGLTAYQAIFEELGAKSGQSLFIAGGSGSFGQMAVPIAKEAGLKVIVSGNAAAENSIREAGADEYIDYKKTDYREAVKNVDFVIDTLGGKDFDGQLSVLKRGGKLLSLRNVPNKRFALSHGIKGVKKLLFTLAGGKFDRKAKKQGKEYIFLFVRSDGEQLRKITDIVVKRGIKPPVDGRYFKIEDINDALRLVAGGHTDGKVIVRF